VRVGGVPRVGSVIVVGMKIWGFVFVVVVLEGVCLWCGGGVVMVRFPPDFSLCPVFSSFFSFFGEGFYVWELIRFPG